MINKEAYLGLYKTSEMDFFAKIFDEAEWKVFAKIPIFDLWWGCESAPETLLQTLCIKWVLPLL